MDKVQAVIITILALILTGCGAGNTVILNPRDGVTQKYLWIPVEKPVATVVLFAGGSGRVDLTSGGTITSLNNNFLIRTNHLFRNEGFNVAIFDAPSDRKIKRGMKGGFRYSSDHATDIAAVVADIKSKSSLPVWLVGTSRGTESAALGAIRFGHEIDGLVLTTSISEPSAHGIELPAMALNKITVPTYIASHEDDQCYVTTPEGSELIKEQLTASSKVELAYFSGGWAPVSGPCEARSQHGFYGIEDEVVEAIARFIKAV